MRFAVALVAFLIATPALAEWTATKVFQTKGNNAAVVDAVARNIEFPAPLVPCPGKSPPFAYALDCAGFGGEAPVDVVATKPAKGGLPDGQIAFGSHGSSITSAWYDDPTQRYRHGALGDTVEGAMLRATLANGRSVATTLPRHEVFEDRVPRIAVLGGTPHIITLTADNRRGGFVAVYGLVDGALKRVAQTPPIGRANRWLNIAGIADFDGSGHQTIAVVETPHLAGVLQFWRWEDGKLSLRADEPGFSNHQNRSREQRLSAVADFDGDGIADLALPSLDRRRLQFVRFTSPGAKQFETFASVRLTAAIDKPITTYQTGKDVVLTVGTADGAVYAVHRK